jgi:ABC-type antimicrobial peptide transport system, permease component
MHIRPILSTLARHKTAAALIVLEVAISCAILCNALFIVSERIARISLPSGVAEAHLVDIRVAGIGNVDQAAARTREDLEALRRIPGVASATVINQVPFQSGSWNTSISTEPDFKGTVVNAAQYGVSSDGLKTLGVNLIAGRDFHPDEYISTDDLRAMADPNQARISLIISQAMAERLFPGEQAVGKAVYMGPVLVRVIGVVETLKRASAMQGDLEMSLIMPMVMNYNDGGFYLLNVADPAMREEVMAAAVKVLEKNDPNRLIREPRTYDSVRARFFSADRDMVGLLLVVSILLLLVTALGIVGLASFWVGQRTRQIGIRRALGATRGQILQYFLTENVLLVSAGIVAGMLLSYGLNQWLMGQYSLPRLPLYYLPIGAVVLWALGLLSVYGPARRAASVPPAVATRSL